MVARASISNLGRCHVKAMTPAGMVRVARDPLPLTVRVELDAAAAEAIGWPTSVDVQLDGAALVVTPAPGCRPTWRGRGRAALACSARLSLPARMLGRWPAVLDAGELVIDTAGPDLGRRAA